MGISSGQRKTMSDEEVRARAKELGMVESTTLSNINIGNVAESQPETKAESTDPTQVDDLKPNETQPKETEPVDTTFLEADTKPSEAEPSAPKQETIAPEESKPVADEKPAEQSPIDDKVVDDLPKDEKPADEKPTDIVPSTDNAEMITIVVKKGDSSVSVSKDLAEAGLVEGAATFDKYLCANGYDKKISVGTYHIPMGASEEDIAKVITGKKSFE